MSKVHNLLELSTLRYTQSTKNASDRIPEIKVSRADQLCHAGRRMAILSAVFGECII